MGLLSRIMSLLGADNDDGPRGSGVDVTVERAPDVESERSTDESRPQADAGSAAEPVGEETGAASTGTQVGEEGTDDQTPAEEPTDSAVDVDGSVDESVDESADEATDDSAAESADEPPIEEAEPDSGTAADSGAETAETESESEPADDSEAESAVDVEDADEPVVTVKGIGPAYAERLKDAGVETVGDLAGADPEELADRIDLSAKRVGRWVDSANDR